MTSKLTLLVSACALALAAPGCGGSRPASKTPATASTEASEAPMTESSAADPGATVGGEPLATSTDDPPIPAPPLTDPQIAAITDSVNSAEIEQARLAQSKSRSEPVQQYAALMIEQHGDAQRKQAALGVAEAESALSLKLAAKTHVTMQDLQQKTGDEFDRAYLKAQIDAHEDALEALDMQLLPSVQDPGLQAYLVALRPKVAESLERARTTEDTLAAKHAERPPQAKND